MIKTLSLTLLFLANTLFLFSQTVTIYNYTDRSPIELVAVYSKDMKYSATSDVFGKIPIEGLMPETVLFFQHPSFYDESFTVKELLDKGKKVFLVEKIIMIEEVVLSADKSPENKSEISNQLDIIYQSEIAYRNPQTSADLLGQSGNVFIQKSQMGGGSPVIRGFEANKVLLVIDGVRMNNAIYRGGHLQNVITIDANVIDRTEIIFGPGSLIYGSDALGGVMHFYTRKPLLSNSEKAVMKLNAMTRIASANYEKTTHLDFSIGSKKLGLLSSITFTDYDDLKSGANRNPLHEDWGLSKYVLSSLNGVDTFFVNSNPQRQVKTEYSQYDILEKLLFQPNEDLEFTLNFQYSNSSDIPRYDRISELNLIEKSTGEIVEIPEYARWDYGPQKRIFGSLSASHHSNNKIYDHMSTVLAFQDIQEQRITRRYRDNFESTRTEDVNVASLNVDLRKKLEKNVLYYGVEYTFNNVESSAEKVNQETSEVLSTSTRYPDGGSDVHSASIYVRNKSAVRDNIFISAGMRFNFSALSAKFNLVPIENIDFSKISIDNTAVTGALDVIYMPNNDWRLNFLLSTGFRSPNVDDVGKIFDPVPGVVVVPNDKLKSEYVYNIEAGVRKRFGEKVEISSTIYAMMVTDLIKRREFSIDGVDSLVYDGLNSQIFANVNTDEAVITGFSADFKADLHPMVSLASNVNYTYGQDISNEEPLAHIPPVYGRTELAIHKGGFKGTFNAIYHGWKKLKRYSPNSDDKLDQALTVGTPSWFTLNINTSYQVNKFFGIQAGIENILDKHYRPFASGVSAAGRNFVVSLRIKA